ncbi:uncharacterized protein LOC125236953 [Leguminivora glycinivorella]|uniref:uncharacterized protein LOC125236953 n=1 Tax=Leguminivora glycinivorella TaxID=1035111 RepID=UPI00200C6F9C|nr:uncharacterized protein LOC125236953 [Leguminivora glycinivorella]
MLHPRLQRHFPSGVYGAIAGSLSSLKLPLAILALLAAPLRWKKYKVQLISATACESECKEKLDPTAVSYVTGVRALNKHTNVATTNFTVLREAGPISMSLKIYHLKGSRKSETFRMEKVDCHNPITYQLVRLINLKLTDDCKIVPGNYVTENINPQDFSWILAKAVGETGRYDFFMYYYTEKGLAICNSIICDIRESH